MNQPSPLYDLSVDVQRLLVRHPLAFILVAMSTELASVSESIVPQGSDRYDARASALQCDARLLREIIPRLSNAVIHGPIVELQGMARAACVVSKEGFVGVAPQVPELPPVLAVLDPPPSAEEIELYVKHGYFPVRGSAAGPATFGDQPFFFRAMFERRPGELVLRVSHEVARALSDEIGRGIITTLDLPHFGSRPHSTHQAKVIAYATHSVEEGTDLVFDLDPKAAPRAADVLRPVPPVMGSQGGEDLAAIVADRAGIPSTERYVAPPIGHLQPGDVNFLLELVVHISRAARLLLPEGAIPGDDTVMHAVERWPVVQQERVQAWTRDMPGIESSDATWWSKAPRVLRDFFESMPGVPSVGVVYTALRAAEILPPHDAPSISAVALLTPSARAAALAWARSRPSEGWWNARPGIINADSPYRVHAALQEVTDLVPSLEAIASWPSGGSVLAPAVAEDDEDDAEEDGPSTSRHDVLEWVRQVSARTGQVNPAIPPSMPEEVERVFAAGRRTLRGSHGMVQVPRVFDLLIALQSISTVVPPIATMTAWESDERIAVQRWTIQKPTNGEEAAAIEAWLLAEPHALRAWRRTDAHQTFGIYAASWGLERTPIVAELVEALGLSISPVPSPEVIEGWSTTARWTLLQWVTARSSHVSQRQLWADRMPVEIEDVALSIVLTIDDVLIAFEDVPERSDVPQVRATILRAFPRAAVRDLSFEDRRVLFEWAVTGAPYASEPQVVKAWRWRAGLFLHEGERNSRMTMAAIDLSSTIEGLAVPSLVTIQAWADEDREDVMAWVRNKPVDGHGNLGRWMLNELPAAMWVFFGRIRTQFSPPTSPAGIRSRLGADEEPETTGAIETVAALETLSKPSGEGALDPRQAALYRALTGALGESWADEVEAFFGRPVREVGLPEMAAWAALEHPGEIVPMLSAWGKLSIVMRDEDKPRIDFFRDRLVGDVAPEHRQALEAFFGMQLDELPISTIAGWVAFYHPEDIAPLLTMWRPTVTSGEQAEAARSARSVSRFQIAIETMLRRQGWSGNRFIWATIAVDEHVRISVRTEAATEYLSVWVPAGDETEAGALQKLFDNVVTMVGRWVAGQHEELDDLDTQDAVRIVVDHLLADGLRTTAGEFERTAADLKLVDGVAALAEAMLIPGELSFSVWERLRPGLGLQKRIGVEVMKALDLSFGHPSTRIYFDGARVAEIFYEGYPISFDRWQKLEAAGLPVLDWPHVAVRRAGAGLTVLGPIDPIGQEQLVILAELAERQDRPEREALRWAIERLRLASRVLLDGPALAESDWTRRDGGTAPAPFFLRVAEDVERMIREGALKLLDGHMNVLAQNIVHRLARHHLLGPQRAELDLITKRHQMALRAIRDLDAIADPIDYTIALLRGLITASEAAEARVSNPKMLPARAAMEAAILRLENGNHPRPAVAALLEAEAAFHRLSSTPEWTIAVAVARTAAGTTFDEARAHHRITAAVSTAAMKLRSALDEMMSGLGGDDLNGALERTWAAVMVRLNEPARPGDSPVPVG